MRHQCELLDLCRSSYYYQCCPETEENLALMRRLDELHLEHPVYGSRKLAVSLRREGLAINRKRVVRLLRLMGIEAIYAKPKTSLPAPVSNTDQGSQFTSPMFIDAVESAGVDVSMDGRGRWIDNRFIERLWRSAKYEDIYLQDYGDGLAAGRGLGRWFDGYNQERPHQALGYATPAEVYFDPGAHGAQPANWEAMQPQSSRPDRKT